MKSINPYNNECIAEYKELTTEEIEYKLEVAEAAFSLWKYLSYAERAAYMKKLAEVLKAQKQELGKVATREMGKPITQSLSEVEKCAWVCEYYADQTESILKNETIESDASESFVRFDPLGVLLAVMPWNFPYWQVFRFLAPALMAGNVAVLKHASNVQGCGAALERIFLEAGFPVGVFQNLSIGSSKVEGILRDKRVKGVALTGSEQAGRKVGAIASDEIKPSVLELGGSDPFIVLSDADLDLAVAGATTSRLLNCGQVCLSAKRFIVVESIAAVFIEKLKVAFESYIVGDPLDEKTQMGPMVNANAVEEIGSQVQDSVREGAVVVTGGKKLEGQGFFYAPTILTNVKKGMRAYSEELFGPVASVIVVQDEQEAIFVANDTDFGLGSSLWTKNMQKAKEIATQMNAGCVFINGIVKSDPRLPFGGVNRSGYGRELSHYGLKQFVNIKTVWIK